MTNQQFTEKSREALAAAQQLTIEYQNQEVTQEHLAYALLSDAQGLIPQLLTKMGKRPPGDRFPPGDDDCSPAQGDGRRTGTRQNLYFQ